MNFLKQAYLYGLFATNGVGARILIASDNFHYAPPKCALESCLCFLVANTNLPPLYAHVTDVVERKFIDLEGWLQRANLTQDHVDWIAGNAFNIRPNPLQILALGKPAYWWFAQAMFFTFQPLPSVQRQIDDTKQAIQYTHPIVAIHVRHGDKFVEAKLHPLAEYMELMKRKFPKIRNIFLMSDDPQVYEDTKDFPNYNFSKHEAGALASTVTWGEVDGDVEVTALSIIIEWTLGAEADGFIGTFSSGYSRNIIDLALGTYGQFHPKGVYSLDRLEGYTPYPITSVYPSYWKIDEENGHVCCDDADP